MSIFCYHDFNYHGNINQNYRKFHNIYGALYNFTYHLIKKNYSKKCCDPWLRKVLTRNLKKGWYKSLIKLIKKCKMYTLAQLPSIAKFIPVAL